MDSTQMKLYQKGIKMRKVIAFAGRQGSGKSFRCSSLVKTQNYKSLAYADALRKIIFVTLGIPYDYGMEHYDELKMTPLYNGQTLRNMMEHLGTEGIRYYDNDFWAKCLLREIEKTPETQDICISDLRFYNEYETLKEFCMEHEYDFQLIFCDYRSDRYEEHNNHASARLANFLSEIGYHDGDVVKDSDMEAYIEAMKN